MRWAQKWDSAYPPFPWRLHKEISDLIRRDTREPRTLKKHVNNYGYRFKGQNAVSLESHQSSGERRNRALEGRK